ncbi:beta-glucosidase [Microbacterium sp. AG790]|uniref:glycoside hydrolase family 3 protein n=1 Tax=Microbacterium sp. AG790 TaxID=2183995 RepID=UPI000EAC8A16|nr:glycoside hydrolase family 3 C-terminal domain-containing protein [Microbacterium sp. AG790]RKS92953.1 beta-glucosidase [Microbacterium sp. AG790]
MTSPVDHLRPLLEKLTLEQKATLVQGADFWTTVPLPEIGLRAMTLSDGPAGVRGPRWDEREPSLNLPSGSALAASWDAGLAYRYGAAAATEARAKDVDVVLGPTINLHRSPLGGRHFECFSEDPQLSGELAAAYVAGMQDSGVAACPKHYVANDSETDRFTVNVEVDERALRELYLAPFERAVADAHAWTIMSSYNSVAGVTMTENDLLETPLNSEWGFDGVVISDWTAVRSLDAVAAAQDLAMPGPAPAWAELVAAVHDGRVEEADLDRKVLRLLLLAERVGALGDSVPAATGEIDGPAFAREAAVAGTVLLSNDGTLPLNPTSLRSVAIIGQNARDARTQGGGSATVVPAHVVSPLDGLRAALPGVEISYELGAIVQEGVAEIPLAQLQNPVTGEPGLRVRFLDAEGAELFAEDRRSTALVWFGGDAPIEASRTVIFETRFTPTESGTIELGFAGASEGRLYVDDELMLDDSPVIEGTDLGAAFLNPPSLTTGVAVEAGVARTIRVEFSREASGALAGALSATVGIAPERTPDAELIARAARAAASAEVAVVVVGTNSRVESEGYDRTSLDLPGAQDALVRAVAATDTPTIVVVNAGSPVVLPWADEVAAVVQGYFGGQEFGHAIADILTGAQEPGGRLPTTWPASLAEVPVTDVTPQDGVLRYTEGIHIGYRAWLKDEATPAFPFGHGLGYTTWSWDDARRDGGEVAVTLTNTGARSGKQVVQVYAERPGSAIERPERWLVGFEAVTVEAGASATVSIALPERRLAHWDGDGWSVEPGTFALRVGSSVAQLPLSVDWEVSA